jgi:hypothetical protein
LNTEKLTVKNKSTSSFLMKVFINNTLKGKLL